MLSEDPSITCICLTNRRANFLHRAISCYKSQTWSNKKLLVVCPADDSVTKHVIASYPASGISILELDLTAKMSLGAVRNYAIAHCDSDYFCQWDDDDWSHIKRLEIQMRAVRENYKSASLLGHWLMFNTLTNEAYMSYYGAWAGSILCSKKNMVGEVKYPEVDKQEDSEFIKHLFKINCLVPVLSPVMYIYVYHGKNTWDANHFEHFFKYSKKLSRNRSELILKILNGTIGNEEASSLLLEEDTLRELDYFHYLEPEEPRKPEQGARSAVDFLTQMFKRWAGAKPGAGAFGER